MRFLLEQYLKDRIEVKPEYELTFSAKRLLKYFKKIGEPITRKKAKKELAITDCQFNNYIAQIRKGGYTVLVCCDEGRSKATFRIES